MTAETHSKRMQNLISSLERVVVGIKIFSKNNLDVQKCYVCVARHIADMTTSPI